MSNGKCDMCSRNESVRTYFSQKLCALCYRQIRFGTDNINKYLNKTKVRVNHSSIDHHFITKKDNGIIEFCLEFGYNYWIDANDSSIIHIGEKDGRA